jgi:hypothetical protein
MPDDLEQRVAALLRDMRWSADAPDQAARAITPMVLERAAKVASEWVADDIEGKRLADLIRAIGAKL